MFFGAKYRGGSEGDVVVGDFGLIGEFIAAAGGLTLVEAGRGTGTAAVSTAAGAAFFAT